MKNKKGWIKIVEAFMGILLIAGVVLLILNQEQEEKDSAVLYYKLEKIVLKEIQLNETLRKDVLEGNFSSELNNTIKNNLPSYLACGVSICNMADECVLNVTVNKDVYAQSTIISSNLTFYNPKQFKLFCWNKN